jgi:hypothetical protein
MYHEIPANLWLHSQTQALTPGERSPNVRHAKHVSVFRPDAGSV